MTGDPTTMRAVVLDAPGPPEALHICEVPVPSPDLGQVLIKVEAFGLNRSELHTRLGLADGVTFPRVLGIEAVGTVVSCPGGELPSGARVAALMGGMGRTFDGGYAFGRLATITLARQGHQVIATMRDRSKAQS